MAGALSFGYGTWQGYAVEDARTRVEALEDRAGELENLVRQLTDRVTALEAALKARDEADELTYDGIGGWT
jgi:hypothetical protein